MLSSELLLRYGNMPQKEAFDAIETAMAEVLTRSFNSPVVVRVDEDGMTMTSLPSNGEPKEILPAQISRKLRRHVLHCIELELQRRQALLESERLKHLQGKIVAGKISGYDREGGAMVEMELPDMFSRLILIGTCPTMYQPLHERGRYIVGQVLYWYITSVLAVANARHAKVRLRLSRTSKELAAGLLRERSGISRIICQKRIPGGPTEIIAAQKIPKDIINSVGKETGDIYRVRILA